jgi:hypothetical protein
MSPGNATDTTAAEAGARHETWSETIHEAIDSAGSSLHRGMDYVLGHEGASTSSNKEEGKSVHETKRVSTAESKKSETDKKGRTGKGETGTGVGTSASRTSDTMDRNKSQVIGITYPLRLTQGEEYTRTPISNAAQPVPPHNKPTRGKDPIVTRTNRP